MTPTALTRETVDYLRELVQRESGIAIEDGKDYLVLNRVTPVAQELGFPDVTQLVRHLRRSATTPPGTVVALVSALTTNETSWFRDPAVFAALADHALPSLAAARAGRPLRMWSAACSTGQEVYSLLIAASETPACAATDLQVLASDINPAMVERARAARYSDVEAVRGLSPERRARHFDQVGTEYVVAAPLRAKVSFKTINLTRPYPITTPFDLVLLRNVLIYFDVATKVEVLTRVRRVIAPDGFLVLGTAESTLGISDAWAPVAGRRGLYRPA